MHVTDHHANNTGSTSICNAVNRVRDDIRYQERLMYHHRQQHTHRFYECLQEAAISRVDEDHQQAIVSMFDTYLRGLSIDDFFIVRTLINNILKNEYVKHITYEHQKMYAEDTQADFHHHCLFDAPLLYPLQQETTTHHKHVTHITHEHRGRGAAATQVDSPPHCLFDAPVLYHPQQETITHHTHVIVSMFDNYLRGLSIEDFFIVRNQIDEIIRSESLEYRTHDHIVDGRSI